MEQLKLNPEIANWRSNRKAAKAFVNDLKRNGQLNKILARKLKDGSLQLIHGHLRLDGCQQLGLKPEIEVRENVSDVEAIFMALSENMQRRDLKPIEEARAFASLRKHRVKVVKIAKAIQHSESYVRQRLALLELPKPIIEKIEEGKLPLYAGSHLIKLKEFPEAQKEIATNFADKIRRGWDDKESNLQRSVESFLDKVQKRKEVFAKYGPCPKCNSKRIEETYTDGKLRCLDCKLEYDAETKNPWEVIEIKRKAKDLGMDISIVNGKGAVLTPKDVAEHIAEVEAAEKKDVVERAFRTVYPLEKWLAAIVSRPENIKRIEVSDDKVSFVLIEGTDLHFRAHSKKYQAGEKGKVTVDKPWSDEGDVLRKRKEAVLLFQEKVVAKQ